MLILEKANELVGQISTFLSVSFVDILSSAFIRLVTFLVNLLLGL